MSSIDPKNPLSVLSHAKVKLPELRMGQFISGALGKRYGASLDMFYIEDEYLANILYSYYEYLLSEKKAYEASKKAGTAL